MPGERELRELIGYDVWAEYYIVHFTDTSIAASSTGTVFEEIAVRLDADAPFAVQSRTFQATSSDMFIEMVDTGKGRYLFDRRKHLRAIAGQPVAGTNVGFASNESLFSPFPLLAPYIFDPAAEVILRAADNSNATNALYFALHGGKIRQGKAPWDREWSDRYQFDYGDQVTVPANGTAPLTININMDSHFLIRAIAGTRASSSLTVRAVDGAEDRNWSNEPVRIDNFMGCASSPNVLPSPRFITRGSSITFTLVDTSGASNLTRIVLHGEKLFE